MPPFERNRETLTALLALAAANEAADEDRRLLARADAAALDELRQRARLSCARRASSPPPRRLTSHLAATVEHQLPTEGRSALDCLACVAVRAGAAFPEPQDLGRAMARLQASLMQLEHMLARVESLGRHVQREADQAADMLSALQRPCYRPHSDVPRLNLDLQRKTKAAAANASLSAHAPRLTIDDVPRQEHHFVALLLRKELDVQVAAFEGLPSDPDMTRSELDALRCHLRHLTSRRDAVFERLVERESPIKRP